MPRLSVPCRQQQRSYTCGAACLRMVMEFFGIEANENELAEAMGTDRYGTTCSSIHSAARQCGIEARLVQEVTYDEAVEEIADGSPIVALLDPSVLYRAWLGFGHFVVVTAVENQTVTYNNPALGIALQVPAAHFWAAWERSCCEGVVLWRE